jgi:hypothetical protein
MVMGVDKHADRLLDMLGVGHIPRYRDCYLEDKYICILTRTGGGNREEYDAANDAMCANQHFSHERDAEFDSTYAEFFYKVPDEHKAEVAKMRESAAAAEAKK